MYAECGLSQLKILKNYDFDLDLFIVNVVYWCFRSQEDKFYCSAGLDDVRPAMISVAQQTMAHLSSSPSELFIFMLST